MPEQDEALVRRVVRSVRWARFNRYKAMVRSDYVLVQEPAIADHLAKMLDRLD